MWEIEIWECSKIFVSLPFCHPEDVSPKDLIF
jgi:hypothetical protein